MANRTGPNRRQNVIYLCDFSYVDGETPLARRFPECPNFENHEPEPSGYVTWFEWTEFKQKTHTQTLCDGCKRWIIWVPKQAVAEHV